MKKTLVVKRKPIIGRGTGKRYGEIVGRGFKANSSEVVEADIRQQIEQLSKTPEDSWRWWQINDDVIMEKSPSNMDFFSSPTFYYLPQKHWKIAQHRSSYFGEIIDWSIHIGDTEYDPAYGCWLFTDLFSDVMICPDNRTHIVLDLDELAEVFETSLISGEQVIQILKNTQALIDLIRSGDFPPPEIKECQGIWIKSIKGNDSM